MTDLSRIFESLPVSEESSSGQATFHALPASSNEQVLIAKTTQGRACLLVNTAFSVEPSPPPLRLENLTVQHNIEGRVRTNTGTTEGTFSLIALRTSDKLLVNMFLRFVVAFAEHLPKRPTASDVSLELQRLVTLLQSLRKPATKTIQGLWAELLLIASRDKPARWINGWHTDPMGLHDFVFGDTRVEVKSTMAHERTHRFSHDQLSTPTGVELYIASILVERSNMGVSLFDLADRIHQKVLPEESLLLDTIIATTLGNDFAKATDIKFEPHRSTDSLLFFPLSIVPRLSEELPARLMDVTYTVRLNDSDGMRSLSIE
ncbi:MAG: PD-(D/E)XK motif protein [Flavobacteriales bacterium]|nr:hypothetical protein [Flavobacteriales bacterium]MCC6576247.1 PD-(D/E)XK motif protein [Flavobacteriales bacterium]NUQ15549.1 PD-(D/E)XK motif protein [Flavobacteriales bacterium]